MAHPFDPASPSRCDSLQLLIAPCGSISADGQLRELMRERRRHAALGEGGEDGDDGEDCGGLWFLPEALCRQHFGLEGMEGLVARASSTAIWLPFCFAQVRRRASRSATYVGSVAMPIARSRTTSRSPRTART